MQNSPISKLVVEEREFFVKRDELIDPFLAGNKYRKLYTLLETPKNRYTTIISYGGTQSNAMLALAALCHQKGWQFIYYTKQLSNTQQLSQEGNYAQALSLGMQHKEIANELYREFIASLSILTDDTTTCIVDQGGADKIAYDGLRVLANEIREQRYLLPSSLKAVATPSGTGTTALYLALNLPEFTVYTTPVIGDITYLETQMQALSPIPPNLIILQPEKKYHFAKPYKEFFEIYKKLKHAGIEFDLLYAPLMWKMLLEKTQEEILYIHSGGITGNKTMLKRYIKKFSVSL